MLPSSSAADRLSAASPYVNMDGNNADNKRQATNDTRQTTSSQVSDAFDYGVGGYVKSGIYVFGACLVFWEIFINSPFFERKLPNIGAALDSDEVGLVVSSRVTRHRRIDHITPRNRTTEA